MRRDGRARRRAAAGCRSPRLSRRRSGKRPLSGGSHNRVVHGQHRRIGPPLEGEPGKPTGWVTAEYSMLPGSTSPRKKRERGQIDGRSQEIQRLVGRSLRAVVDMAALGPRTVTVDCDVLEADGGTRTASITGGFIGPGRRAGSIRDKLPDDRPPDRQ